MTSGTQPAIRIGARPRLRTALLTALALLAFAGNSWLCRAALRPNGMDRAIDPASFTAVRIASGALVLCLLVIVRFRGGEGDRFAGSFGSACALFAYAIAFSFAYLELSAGVGALILFGAVQLTMLAGGFLSGQAPTVLDGAGIALALGGLAWLALPGATRAGAPEPLAALGMALAGMAWGVYSLRGRREKLPPLAVTAGNFLRAVPLALAVLAAAFALSSLQASPRGLLFAGLSGALTSGVGYAIWYAALPGLKAAQAGLVQLAVPVLTALGGVLFLAERLSVRLMLATALVLAGIALALAAPRRAESRTILREDREAGN